VSLESALDLQWNTHVGRRRARWLSRSGRVRRGIEIGGKPGDPVLAVADGKGM
jgi:murein DD-endopeptidase MepM/ murein hydrolase activator NlpD